MIMLYGTNSYGGGVSFILERSERCLNHAMETRGRSQEGMFDVEERRVMLIRMEFMEGREGDISLLFTL